MSTFFHLAIGNALLVTLLCLPAWLLARLCRRPAVSHAVWLLVLLKLVCPPLWEISLPSRALEVAVRPTAPQVAPVPITSAGHPELADETCLAHDAVGPFDEVGYVVVLETETAVDDKPAVAPAAPALAWRWPRLPTAAVLALAVLWGVGGVSWLVLAVARAWRFERIVRRALPAPSSLTSTGRELAAQFGLRTAPEIVVTSARVSPLLWATWRRPRIVLPEALLARLTPAQQSTIVAHELAHLARGDHRLRWLETLVLAAYWWLPAAWWARRKLSEAEEQCCDALVVARLPQRARAYASALLETVEFLADPPVALPALASGLGTAFPLKRRFEMILKEHRGAAAPKLAGRLALATALVALPLSPLGLRAWAEESNERTVEVAVSADLTTEAKPEVAKVTEQQVEVGLELVADNPNELGLEAPVTVAVDFETKSDLAKPTSDVAARIGKLEETLVGLLAELRALKAANGLGGALASPVEERVLEHVTPDGTVERKVIRIDGKGHKVDGKPTITLHRAQLDGRRLVLDGPDGGGRIVLDGNGKGGLSRQVIEFRAEGSSRGEVLRKEREALERRLKEIAEEEQGLSETQKK
ncbi:MAG: M56 family metallopeptidase [Pirellulales bacterium]